jgi:hypothetical protein
VPPAEREEPAFAGHARDMRGTDSLATAPCRCELASLVGLTSNECGNTALLLTRLEPLAITYTGTESGGTSMSGTYSVAGQGGNPWNATKS